MGPGPESDVVGVDGFEGLKIVRDFGCGLVPVTWSESHTAKHDRHDRRGDEAQLIDRLADVGGHHLVHHADHVGAVEHELEAEEFIDQGAD